MSDTHLLAKASRSLAAARSPDRRRRAGRSPLWTGGDTQVTDSSHLLPAAARHMERVLAGHPVGWSDSRRGRRGRPAAWRQDVTAVILAARRSPADPPE